jgi:hypothetical protein
VHRLRARGVLAEDSRADAPAEVLRVHAFCEAWGIHLRETKQAACQCRDPPEARLSRDQRTESAQARIS